MADAPKKIEKVISKEFSFNRNDFNKIILKAGHHGSKTSSDKDFIINLNPTDVILSYGLNNRYGHPNKEVLDIFSLIPNIKIHRTVWGTVYFKE